MGKPPALTFKQFLLRQQAISLYRDLLRATRRLEDSNNREDLRKWIRMEFDQWKPTTDEDTAKLLLTQGRQALRELQTSIEMTK